MIYAQQICLIFIMKKANYLVFYIYREFNLIYFVNLFNLL